MKTFLALLLFVLVTNSISAQAPFAIPFQAVARNANGLTVNNQNISARFTILASTPSFIVVFRETHSTITNDLGLFSLNIGQGSPVFGSLSTINWGVNSKFLQVEIDITGGTNYVDMGTQQMMSVPYSLYSGKSETGNYTGGQGISINGNVISANQPLTIQERLDAGETPKHIFDTGVPKDLIIGKLYVGGIIFFLNTTTGSGLVAATIDQATEVMWDDGSYANIQGTSLLFRAGQSNTSIIVGHLGAGNYAAYLCDTLTLNGYTDWYLPSGDELVLMNIIMNIPGYFLISAYWSSTQYGNIYQQAYMFQQNGSVPNNRPKADLLGVRAIRTF